MNKKELIKQKAIVEAANRIFSRFGYKKSTLEDIAQAARMAKSSLYYYFKSKEEILQAVVEQEIELAMNELGSAISSHSTPQEKLRAYSVMRLKILNRLGNYYSVLQDEYVEQYSFIDKIRRKHDHNEMALIGSILAEGVQKGIFSVQDVELTAFAIVTALKGFEYVWAVENNISETEESIDSLLEILFNGIMKR
jgi:AcrR family transcriptional regulator